MTSLGLHAMSVSWSCDRAQEDLTRHRNLWSAHMPAHAQTLTEPMLCCTRHVHSLATVQCKGREVLLRNS